MAAFAITFAADITAENKVTIEVKTPGTLKQELGENINSVTELTVTGTVNDNDVYTMWECGFYGNCRTLDISGVTFECEGERNIVPTYAFFKEEIQGNPADDSFKPIKIEQIILPDHTFAIGPQAFKGVTLKQFRMPQGMVYIFEGAFEYSNIEYADMADTRLEVLHRNAFSHSTVSEVSLPAWCIYYMGGCFDYCANLKKITMCGSIAITGSISSHSGLEYIDFAEFSDTKGQISYLPSNAFANNRNLHDLNITGIVRSISKGAFEGSGLRRVMFEDVTTLDTGSFTDFPELTEIYCKSAVPPATIDSDGVQQYPFGGSTPKTATVYVPMGYADIYRNTEGWNYFTNFVEITEFPTLGIPQTPASEPIPTFARAIDGGIEINGEGSYSVWTIDGVAVAHGKTSGQTVNIACETGIYVVRLADRSQKVSVR